MAEKKIVSRAHLDAFLASQTHDEVLQFVEAMNESSIGITLQADSYESEASMHDMNSCLLAKCVPQLTCTDNHRR